MGLGAMGGGAQMLFGGSGGQDLFQKITWFLGAVFMIGSLALAIAKSRAIEDGSFINRSAGRPRTHQSSPEMPAQQSMPASATAAPQPEKTQS